MRGLWRGTGPTVIRLTFGAGLNFALLEVLKSVLEQQQDDGSRRLEAGRAAVVGGLSRAIAAAVMCPVTLVKTRMEYSGADGVKYKNTFHALATIARTEGPAQLFRGLGPTVMTNAPFSALYYMFYTRLREGLSHEGRPQTFVNFGSGVCAATAATLLTQPTDVLRTTIQLRLAGGDPGVWSITKSILQSQGPGGLFTGAGPRILKRTTQTALVWTLYEELMPRLSNLWLWAQALPDQGPEGPLNGG